MIRARNVIRKEYYMNLRNSFTCYCSSESFCTKVNQNEYLFGEKDTDFHRFSSQCDPRVRIGSNINFENALLSIILTLIGRYMFRSF